MGEGVSTGQGQNQNTPPRFNIVHDSSSTSTRVRMCTQNVNVHITTPTYVRM
jgi:hypothetical protein